MTMTDIAQRPAVDADASFIARHPRGRGFGILSRLARTDDTAGRHVREDAATDQPGGADEHAAVLTFDRRSHHPRHRRDDRGLLNFG
jgi:hypothetical protein